MNPIAHFEIARTLSGVSDMHRFDHIHVRGFRRLHDFNLELRPLCVLVGANGSGKTSLLDIFSILAASVTGGLASKLSELGGIASLVSLDGPTNQRMSLSLSMTMPQDNPLIYDLRLVPTGVAYEIEEETLTQQRDPNPPRSRTSSPGLD